MVETPATKHQIKIVHVIDSFGIGGLEKGVAMLVNHAPKGFVHEIICMVRSGDSERLLKQSVPIYPMGKSPGNSLRFLVALIRRIRSLRPCIVHTRNWGGMDGIIAARLAGAEAIVHGEHGWDVGDADGCNKKRIVLRRLLSAFVDQYICVSAHMTTWLKNTVGITKRVNQIYNGIDTDLYNPNPDETSLKHVLGIPEKYKVVGIVGRLDPIKNHSLLIKSFNQASRGFTGAKLIIVGDGPERNRLEAQGGENVIFLGQRDDIPRLMRVFDVFVLPSINEGISNTILEAMASALPVVATRVGGSPEIVRNGYNGLLVECNDEEGLANAIRRYIENPNLCKIHGANGRNFVEKHFSINTMSASYHRIYSKITSERSDLHIFAE